MNVLCIIDQDNLRTVIVGNHLSFKDILIFDEMCNFFSINSFIQNSST